MPTPAILMVRSSCSSEHRDEFNDWYSNVHIHDVARRSGARNARRFVLTGGDDQWEYLALYEFDDEKQLDWFMQSEELKQCLREFDETVGSFASRVRTTYRQIAP